MRTEAEIRRAQVLIALLEAAYQADDQTPSREAHAISWVLEWILGGDNGFNDMLADQERALAETAAQFARHGNN